MSQPKTTQKSEKKKKLAVFSSFAAIILKCESLTHGMLPFNSCQQDMLLGIHIIKKTFNFHIWIHHQKHFQYKGSSCITPPILLCFNTRLKQSPSQTIDSNTTCREYEGSKTQRRNPSTSHKHTKQVNLTPHSTQNLIRY